MHCTNRRRLICLMSLVILVSGALALPIPAVAKSGTHATSSGTNKPPATTTATTAKGTNKVSTRKFVVRKAGGTQMEYLRYTK